ncbi:MAG: class II aldolase/adducin family protein [Egibacteraceae bacterium]
MRLQRERELVVEYSQRMVAEQLTVGTSGNVSCRADELIAITPGGVDYAELDAGAICVLNLDGEQVEGDLEPSSEVPMHTAVYKARETAAVVHTHPLYTTTVSVLRDELPAVHYMLALLGGAVRVTPYETYGTQALAESSVRGLEGRTGVILGNHGATTIGGSLHEAFMRSLYLEWAARLWCEAAALGQPRVLDGQEIAKVAEKLRSYGQSRD